MAGTVRLLRPQRLHAGSGNFSAGAPGVPDHVGPNRIRYSAVAEITTRPLTSEIAVIKNVWCSKTVPLPAGQNFLIAISDAWIRLCFANYGNFLAEQLLLE